MNLDTVVTDEFGNLIPSAKPKPLEYQQELRAILEFLWMSLDMDSAAELQIISFYKHV